MFFICLRTHHQCHSRAVLAPLVLRHTHISAGVLGGDGVEGEEHLPRRSVGVAQLS